MTALVEEADASPEVRAIYEDIKATRRVDSVTNFWKAVTGAIPGIRSPLIDKS